MRASVEVRLPTTVNGGSVVAQWDEMRRTESTMRNLERAAESLSPTLHETFTRLEDRVRRAVESDMDHIPPSPKQLGAVNEDPRGVFQPLRLSLDDFQRVPGMVMRWGERSHAEFQNGGPKISADLLFSSGQLVAVVADVSNEIRSQDHRIYVPQRPGHSGARQALESGLTVLSALNAI